MTIKDKAKAFATNTPVDTRYDRIAIDERGCTIWDLLEYSTNIMSSATFNLATKKPVKRAEGSYIVSFCYGGKVALSKLKALGEIYGFIVDSRGYFVATKSVRLVSGERLKKGDVLGYMYCAIVVGGKK